MSMDLSFGCNSSGGIERDAADQRTPALDPLKCVAEGPEGSFLDGCPWNAIAVVVTSAWEREHGVLPY